MSSIIRQLINRLHPENLGQRVVILGLDYSGKTTLLYFLKLGQIVQAIPSIGFNVETVDLPNPGGKKFRIEGWDVGTACGITYLYGLIQVYVEHSKAIVWVVDSADKERLSESVDSLEKVLANAASKSGGSGGVSKLAIPVLILANKSDKPNALSLDQIRIAFAKATSGRLTSVFKTSVTEKTLTATGVPEAFAWLQLAMEIAEHSTNNNTRLPESITVEPKVDTRADVNPRSATTLAHKLEAWLMRVDTDSEPKEFLKNFHSFTLPEWDHYTHIRIAYIFLTKYGRREGKDMIFKGIEKYISVSPQTKGRSFHVTMTYFWIQIVHFGIRNVPPSASDDIQNDSLSENSEKVSSTAPDQLDKFSRFLLINPYVVDGNLWSDYYSKDTMMSPKAKSQMVLPDKKPLPNLIVRDTITTFGAKGI